MVVQISCALAVWHQLQKCSQYLSPKGCLSRDEFQKPECTTWHPTWSSPLVLFLTQQSEGLVKPLYLSTLRRVMFLPRCWFPMPPNIPASECRNAAELCAAGMTRTGRGSLSSSLQAPFVVPGSCTQSLTTSLWKKLSLLLAITLCLVWYLAQPFPENAIAIWPQNFSLICIPGHEININESIWIK